MQRMILLIAAVVMTALLTSTGTAGGPLTAVHRAHADRGAQWHNTNRSWHGGYQHVQWGHPVALIVPPTANFQTEYSWGVARTTMRPLHHQFGRPIATPGGYGNTRRAPRWPSSTTQIGVYPVRGPW